MKLRNLLSICLVGASFTMLAQTHVEGIEYYKADQLENARELLSRNLNNSGTNKAAANFYLGMIALENKNDSEAASYFSKGVAADPEYGYNYVGEGFLKLKAGDPKEASKLFNEAASKEKKSAEIYIAIARAYYNCDPVTYTKDIEKNLEKARKKDPNCPDIYLFEGDRLLENKTMENIGQAAAKYEYASTVDPNETAAYVKYANLYTMVNPQFAIKMLNNLLSVNPTSALGQREIANAYYNNKDYTNAALKYGDYVKNPNHFKQDEDRYAFLLFYGGKYKEGYDFATDLLKSNPENFTARRYQFMNAAQLPELKDALLPLAEELYATHKMNPDKNKFASIDYTLISEELENAGRADEAIEVLKEGIATLPDNSNFYKQLAMAYVNANDITSAADAYSQYLAKTENPNFNDYSQQATFSFYAGVENKEDAEKMNKYFNDALNYVAKASEKMPDHYLPYKMKGDVAKQLADQNTVGKVAAEDYLKAIELLEASADPSKYTRDAKEMYNYIGNYYLDLKDVAKAKQYFNKYLELDPDNADYRQFVNGLK